MRFSRRAQVVLGIAFVALPILIWSFSAPEPSRNPANNEVIESSPGDASPLESPRLAADSSAQNRDARPASQKIDSAKVRTAGSSRTSTKSKDSAAKSLAAACNKKARHWREQLGDEGRVVVYAPFVIGGDLSTKSLDSWYRNTIGPASRAMAEAYFDAPPSEVITILLFSGEASYNRFAKELFGEEGISVYGYYKPAQRVLVMNIGTGGGTLVHELTHALIDFDFPQVPDWFNEGLASLHEQCHIRQDESGIDGLENWRLPGLKQAIEKGKLRSLRELFMDDDFRGRNVGINYAQARYFCLYLQRQGLLESFYERFREAHEEDPQGVLSIKGIFPEHSWEELDQQFSDFVLTLNFDPS